MKIHKKIRVGLFSVITILVSLFVLHNVAYAAGFPAYQIQSARVYFVSEKSLSVEIGGQSYEFDGKLNDTSTHGTYSPQDNSLFCSPAGTSRESYLSINLTSGGPRHPDQPLGGKIDTGGFGDPAAVPTSVLYAGLNAQSCQRALPDNKDVTYKASPPPSTAPGAAFTSDNVGNIKASDFKFIDGANISLTFNGKTLVFNDSHPEDNNRNFTAPNGSFCTDDLNGITFQNSDQAKNPIPIQAQIAFYDIKASNNCVKKPLSLSIGNPGLIATKVLEYNESDIQSLTGTLVLSQQGGSSVIYLAATNDPCGGGWAVKLSSAGANSGVLYQVNNKGNDANTIGLPNCKITSQRNVLIGGTIGQQATPPSQPGPGNVTGTNDACYQSGWALSWLACPVITTAQTTANAMYGFVEDQLKFTVQQNCTKDSGCNDSLGGDYKSVHSAWSNFRILVSGLVVILLLVMVISQAIGTGPFDAYTVRKMLPRLVMGVILIQISWPLFSWIVNTVDHLGVGLADVMYAPFGGADALNLNTIMEPFTGGTAEAFNWIGFLGVAIGAIVAPFLMLGIILTVLVAIFAGFLTLLFRKIIIILALIFVPVALISWMMPNDGLRKYWKLWWDNFIKALMMFPLIIALIAGGRIFAKIGSGQSDFVGFFIVLVGFFGPLFILPKTFKWGGTLMQTVGNGLTKAQERTLKKPKEFLGERQKGYTEERRLKSKERVAAGKGFNPRRPWRYPVDKFRSGQWDPTLTGRRAERALATYKKTGRDAYTEDLAAARIGQQIDWENMVEGDGIVKDDYLQDVYEGKHSIDEKTGKPKEYKTFDGRTLNPLGKKPMEKLAALYEMEKLGGATNNRHILKAWESAQEAGPQSQEYSNFRRFMSDSVGTMLPSLTDVYKGTLSTADAGPAGVAKQHGVEVENMLATLTNRIEREQNPTKKAGHIQTLNTYLDSFLSAAENDNLRGGIEQGATRVVKALVTNDSDARDKILGTKPGQVGTVYYDPEDGRVSIGLGRTTDKDGKIVDNTQMATGADVMAAIRPDLRARLDKIIRTEGGFVDSETIKASAREEATAGAQPTQTVEIDLHPGETLSSGGVVIAPERRTRPPTPPEPGGDSTPPSPPPAAPTPPSPPPTAGGDTSAGPESQQGIPPEDFGPGGRFPPPNIPPGPGDV